MGDHSTEVLLSTGIAFHSGGCDKAGHPLVIFPTEYQSALTQTSEEDLLSLLHYFRKIVSDEQRRQGFTFLVNLQKSSTQFIAKLVSALNSFQLEVKPEVGVHSLYTIKPKTSKLQAHFEKLTGLKESKKAATANIYQVHILKDFASLHRSVEKVSLTDEFGGHQQFNLPAWIRFRLAVDELTSCVAKCREQIDECRDQLRVLCELEINDDTQSLLDSINSKYTSIMSQLNLDYAIEKCGSMLEELSAGKGQVKVVQGDMLRELVKFTRSSNKQLCEVREDFQLLWRKAQARVVQASQLKVHQKNANKISKWINKNGSISLAELSRPIRSLEDVTSSRQRLAELSKSCQYQFERSSRSTSW
ncbi:PURA [Bugula neritina]|uniref:PURA n=1 Tax=Bugula neritina TaxID=10212 RepID=A0A7J7KGK0_BUGNE|nr:PURA [Bugula neritina]